LPLYFIFEEHYCYDPKNVVPQDETANGMKNAWLPEDLQITETQVSVLPWGARLTVVAAG
jgi:hypothetical protein